MKIPALLFFAICCFGQISAPRIGFVRDRAGALRPVQGIAGAFVLGDPVVTGVVAASFSEHYGFVKTSSELLILIDGEVKHRFESPDGLASFGFDASGKPNWVRFVTNDCMVVDKDQLRPGTCPESDPETSVQGDELVIRSSQARIRLPEGVISIEKIADGWLALQTADGMHLVRTERDREALFALPESSR